MGLTDKIDAHKAFWRGEGPCLILIPAPEPQNLPPYRLQFEDPRLMWEAQRARARAVVNWPTDGIPTIRANLGVVFMPAILGQEFHLVDDQMPWPGRPLDEDTIRRAADVDVSQSDLMRRAEALYELYRESGESEIAAYLPDTQGVFDVAHLLYGHALFTEILDESRQNWVAELMEICLDLYVRVSRHMKAMLGEEAGTMIHGHGTAQGVYFPHGGARVSEDTAILLSPETIATWIMPYVERALRAFGGGFVHYCGRHEDLFAQLCRSDPVLAIDVQPGMHDTHWLLERCAESDTVLYSATPAEQGESWRAFVRRLAGWVRETGARCIIRPQVYPDTRAECHAMQEMWHELTV